MNSDGQERFIKRVRQALGKTSPTGPGPADPFPGGSPDEPAHVIETAGNRDAKQKQRLVECLMESARRHDITAHIHAGMQSAAREMAAIVLEQEPEWGAEKSVVAWRHPLVEGLKLPEALAPHRVPVHFCDHDVSSPVEKQVFVTKAATACVGITSADFCLADSGTLVLKTRPGQALSVSIAPSVHMAVFAAEQIVADLKELYALLTCEPGHAAEGLTRSMTFVCGPSKTADIEATLIHGAHGPREVHIFIIRS